MTIEEALSRLALNTGRIADALEAIAGSQGIVVDLPEEEEEEKPVEEKAPAKKKAAKKAPAKKKAAKKADDDLDDDDDAPAKLTLKDHVRPIMKRLRDEVNHAAVKSLLRKYNAATLQQLDEQDYALVIADAEAELE